MARHNWKWIFGLSIDEDLQWAMVQADASGRIRPDGERYHGVFCALPHTKMDLQKTIIDHLSSKLPETPARLLGEVESVGISTVGIVNSTTKRLMNFDRKEWKPYKDNHGKKYLVDFTNIARMFFSKYASSNCILEVQNDATAKGLAEFQFQKEVCDQQRMPFADLLCYVMFHDGVNAGFIHGDVEADGHPVAYLMHQELGHMLPRPHPHDINFDPKFSGCLVHKNCFVGLAGGTRIKRQWGHDFPKEFTAAEILRETMIANKRDSTAYAERPWDIISWYIASFCWNAVLTIPPQRILLAGEVISQELLPLVRNKFSLLNTYLGERYIEYPELERSDFISLASIDFLTSGVTGGLELARRGLAIRHKSSELVKRANH